MLTLATEIRNAWTSDKCLAANRQIFHLLVRKRETVVVSRGRFYWKRNNKNAVAMTSQTNITMLNFSYEFMCIVLERTVPLSALHEPSIDFPFEFFTTRKLIHFQFVDCILRTLNRKYLVVKQERELNFNIVGMPNLTIWNWISVRFKAPKMY